MLTGILAGLAAGALWGLVFVAPRMTPGLSSVDAAWLKRHREVNATEWASWLGIATGVGAVLLWLAAGSEPNILLALDQPVLAAVVCLATGVGSAWLGILASIRAHR